MKIICCFFKKGEEGKGWTSDIHASSNEEFTFIPFNIDGYLDIRELLDSVSLDRLYRKRHPGLLRLYTDFESLVKQHAAGAVIVYDAPPFHPDYLRSLPLYRVLYSHDDPESTYLRNIPYLHAYHHVMYVTPAYTSELSMEDKMRECGMVNVDFVPNGALSFDYFPDACEDEVFGGARDIDILFIGAFHWAKIDRLVAMKKHFGERFRWNGFLGMKHNLYLTARNMYPFWVRPVTFSERRSLLRRAKICINIHNGYDVPNVGNQRMFYAPANGALLVTDGVQLLDRFFRVGEEVVGYSTTNQLLERVLYFLDHEDERIAIARRGYHRVIAQYRFVDITRRIGALVRKGMNNIGWKYR